MKIQKTSFALMLCVISALVFTACSGGSPSAVSSEPQPSQSSLASIEQAPAVDSQISTAGETIEIIDALERTVTIQGPVERVYYGFYYENLLAIGGPDILTKVAATSLYDTEGYMLTLSKLYRENVNGYTNMVDIGSTFTDDFNIEKLLDMDLDVIILAKYQYTALENRVSVLESAGIPVVVVDYSLGTMEMQCKSTEILGKIFGVEERAQKIIQQYKDSYADIDARVSKITEKKEVFGENHSAITTYTEIGSTGGGKSFLANYINNAGGINLMDVFMSESGQEKIDPEYLLEADPDTVFIVGGESSNKSKEGVLMGHGVAEEQVINSAKNLIPSRPGWDTLQAVKNNQIFVVENSVCRTMGDYVVTQFMAKSLYPELFEDIDPLENMKTYYAEYLPMLPLEGTFFYQYKPISN